MLVEFLSRAMWAVIGIPALLILAYMGGWWLFVPLALLIVVGLAEYYSGAMAGGYRPAVGLGFAVGVGVLAATIFAPGSATEITVVLLVALAAGSLVSVLRPGFKHTAVASSAITVFGVVYVAVMMSFLARLCQVDLPAAIGVEGLGEFWHRLGALVVVVIPVWFCDTFAFVAGKTWGQRRLAPNISPNKSVEGAIAGFLAALLSALAITMWMGMPWYHSVILGVLIGSVTQVGDLSSSILKRNLEIDDFGTIFGAHGGFLDRFDGLLFNMPLVYYYLLFFFVILK